MKDRFSSALGGVIATAVLIVAGMVGMASPTPVMHVVALVLWGIALYVFYQVRHRKPK